MQGTFRKLRVAFANGFVAMHNLASNGSGVVMSSFQHKREQKWHTHPA